MRNPEKLATLGRQDTRRRKKRKKQKTNKDATQHNMCWTPLYTDKHK